MDLTFGHFLETKDLKAGVITGKSLENGVQFLHYYFTDGRTKFATPETPYMCRFDIIQDMSIELVVECEGLEL